jgi:hypothetical protein
VLRSRKAWSLQRALGSSWVELQDLGAQDLKGIVGSVRAWEARRESSAEGRFEAFHAGGLTELVGREEELELLLRRWSKAKTGEGQVVLLSGEDHRSDLGAKPTLRGVHRSIAGALAEPATRKVMGSWRENGVLLTLQYRTLRPARAEAASRN